MYMHLHRHPEARGYCVIDLDLKKEVLCFAANDETGEYEGYVRDIDGKYILVDENRKRFKNWGPDSYRTFKLVNGKEVAIKKSPVLLTETKKGNIKIVRASEKDEFIKGA